MKSKSFLEWFATKQGRESSFIAMSVLALGSSTAYFSTHTFFVDKYKEIVQMYGLGEGIPVSSKVKKRIEEVMDEMQISEKARKHIKPFTVFGYDMFHAGCTYTRTGAIIGIPSNFNYETTSDVDQQHILVNLDQVSWGSEAGKKLLDAMVLSEAAQKFAIGREIAYVQTYYVYYHSIFPASMIIFTHGLTSHLNKKLSLLHRSLPLRLILYSLTGLFGFGIWMFLQDFTTVHYEMKSDKAMILLGEEYIKGGLEFYSKLLQRNIALRTLMGEKGEKLYSAIGNNQFLLRQKHLPLTIRKEYFELQLEELKKIREKPSTVVSIGPSSDDTNTKIAPSV